MKSRELAGLQDAKPALYSSACTWLYCQKSARACITRVTCGPCVKLEIPHLMSSFVLTCLLIISETINPNPAVPPVSENRTRLEGLKNTGIDKAPGFYPRTNLLKPGPSSSHCGLHPQSCKFHVPSLRNPCPGIWKSFWIFQMSRVSRALIEGGGAPQCRAHAGGGACSLLVLESLKQWRCPSFSLVADRF